MPNEGRGGKGSLQEIQQKQINKKWPTDKDESRFPTEISRKMMTALTKIWDTNGRRKGGRQE